MTARRHSDITAFARRLTAAEVARFWFRRGADFARVLHTEHPDFPRPGPDGLYLGAQIEAWFDRWHGRRQTGAPDPDAEEEALRIARHGRRPHSPRSH